MRHPHTVGVLVSCVVAVACGPGGTPASPTSPSTSVAPFIVSSPSPHVTGDAPSVWGVWTGVMQLSDCRAAPPSVCKVAPGPRDIRLVVEQRGSSLTGVFSMNEPSVTGLAFTGYVTADGGIAGTAALGGSSRVLVRLSPSGSRFSGEVSDEIWTSGWLTFARHFVVSTPLTRVGPTL